MVELEDLMGSTPTPPCLSNDCWPIHFKTYLVGSFNPSEKY